MNKTEELKKLLIELKYITEEQLDSFKKLKDFARSIDDGDYVLELNGVVKNIYKTLSDFERELGYQLIYDFITD
jgi:hypothetical protein